MSITFRITDFAGLGLLRCTCPDEYIACDACNGDNRCPSCQLEVNMSERNARDVLMFLGVEFGLGISLALNLARLCRLGLAVLDAEPHVRAYLRQRTSELLQIALSAGNGGWVGWA